MKSFRIYLPGGRQPTGPGLTVIAVAVLTMLVCAFQLDNLARIVPRLTVGQAKLLLILLGLGVIGLGWLCLRMAGVPFSKKEATSESSAVENPGNGRGNTKF